MMTLEKTGAMARQASIGTSGCAMPSWPAELGARDRTQTSLMKLKGPRQSIAFPLDFTPNGVACSFGDVPSWNPMPFHLAAAMPTLPPTCWQESTPTWRRKIAPSTDDGGGQNLLLYLAHASGKTGGHRATSPSCILNSTGAFAGSSARRVRSGARGGTTKLPHSHLDLMSSLKGVADEAMVSSLGNAEYMDIWQPLPEIFEMTPAAKNTILINGVGITVDSRWPRDVVQGKNWKGIRIDATEAMGRPRRRRTRRRCSGA